MRRDKKSIVAARESGCCVTPSFCVNAARLTPHPETTDFRQHQQFPSDQPVDHRLLHLYGQVGQFAQESHDGLVSAPCPAAPRVWRRLYTRIGRHEPGKSHQAFELACFHVHATSGKSVTGCGQRGESILTLEARIISGM